MTKAEWGAIEFFTPSEFDSPDKPGSGEAGMQYDTIRALDAARRRSGLWFKINSGFRTKKHNADIGGRKNSAHLRGYAADIDLKEAAKRAKVTIPNARRVIIDALEFAGFKRMGIYRTFIHADMDPSLPPNVIWVEGE